MVDLGQLPAFLVVAIVLVVAPGPDFAMTTRNVLRGGRLPGVLTAMGAATGASVWTSASVIGLVAILQLSSAVFEGIRLAGAMYLVGVGAHALMTAYRERRAGGTVPEAQPFPHRPSNRAAFRQGLLTNLLNPKAAVIFTSVLPQFVGSRDAAGPQLVLLGSIMVLMIGAWLSVYAMVASRMLDQLRGRWRWVLDAVTGVVLTVLGVRLAVD